MHRSSPWNRPTRPCTWAPSGSSRATRCTTPEDACGSTRCGPRWRADCTSCRSCASASVSHSSASRRRCGWTTRSSTSPTTCTRPRCRHPVTRPSCSIFRARLMSSPLDRSHPLWEIWLIDGLEGGRVAVLEMLHHAMADGLAGVELATVLLDLEPRAPTAHAGDGWEPAPPPNRTAVAVEGLAQWADAIWRLSADGLHAVRHPSRAGHLLTRYVGAYASLLPRAAAVPDCSLNVPVGFDRRAVAVRQPLDALRLHRAPLRCDAERPALDRDRQRRPRPPLRTRRGDGGACAAGARAGRVRSPRRPPAGQRGLGHGGTAPDRCRPGN